jgi:hypothetical protein
MRGSRLVRASVGVPILLLGGLGFLSGCGGNPSEPTVVNEPMSQEEQKQREAMQAFYQTKQAHKSKAHTR